MHLKKTKKTPRTIRIIALMLSLVLMFFTMTGMALAEEGTDVPDAAPDSTLEIVEAELELEPGPTENLLPRLPAQRKHRNPHRSRKNPLSHRNPRIRLCWSQIMSWTRKSRLAGTMRRLRSPSG